MGRVVDVAVRIGRTGSRGGPIATRILLVLAVAMLSVPLAPTTASAGSVYYVDDDGENGNLGTSASPWRTIEHAVSQASAGDTIMVKPGTYAYEPAGEQDFPISLPAGVRLVSTDGPYDTTISGNGTHSVITIANATAGTEVRGFTIENGGAVDGSGIKITRNTGGSLDGWPVIAQNIITGNGGGSRGGGIYVEGVSGSVCSPLIEDNEITDNTATEGSGIACPDYASPVIRDNDLYSNSSGEGIWVIGECGPSIVGNRVSTNGGRGIYMSRTGGGTVDIVGNSIGGNQGGLFLSSGTYTVEGNLVVGNGAGSDMGGGLKASNAGVTCTNNLWRGNFAPNEGGAVYAQQATVTHNGDTFYANTSVTWNGVYAEDAPMHEADITLRNCILWGQASEDAYNCTISYCDTQDTNLTADGNTEGLGIIHTDPAFLMDGVDDLHLDPSSPCIDAGDPKSYPAEDYLGTDRPQDGDAAGIARPDMGFYEHPESVVERFAGDNRYDTACQVVREWFDSADTVVLASGEDFPDALSAAGLAGTYEAPLLLTAKDSLPSVVASTLSALGTSDIIIVGGPAAVSSAVQSTLSGSYDVRRISGANRYDTAARVAREIAQVEAYDGNWNGWAFVARGDEFPDALALAPISYYAGSGDDGCPILLTQPDALPGATADAIDDLGIWTAYVAGGTAAVSNAVMGDVETLLAANSAGWQSGRWKGANRFETAVAVANGGYATFLDHPEYVGIATGFNFPDALAGGAAAGVARDGVVLLTEPDSLPGATRNMLAAHKDDYLWVEIYGGEAAVSSTVRDAVDAAMGW
jgi:parallel beta-helix repeat protein